MTKKIRLRFPPSPTGYLHVGGLRTVLFNYLIAKKLKGDLILRIEDTDQKREIKGAVDQLIKIINWLGFEFREGPHIGGDYGPYIQSERQEIYNEYARKLLSADGAYYCFCSSERLREMREEQQARKQAPKYDRKCLNLSEKEIREKIARGEEYVLRQKMPSQGEVVVKDFLRGEIKFQASDLEDHVLIKSNGVPTYQFASVVDDHLMKISHVVRGEEWLPSFPKNVLLYQSFGWEVPKFIHLPLILDKNGGKLSKRKGDVTVEDYKEKGYLPEALINFTALLGWHPKDDEEETMSLEEIIKKFKMKDIGVSPATFDVEKLNYFNGYYIRQMDLDSLTRKCQPYLKENLKKTQNYKKKEYDFVKKVVSLEQERLKKISEIKDLTEFFFLEELNYPGELLIWKKMSAPEVKNNLKEILELLNALPEEEWKKEKIEEKIIGHIKEKEGKVGNYLWPLRVALTGQSQSPGPFEVAWVLGKKESLEKIKKAGELL